MSPDSSPEPERVFTVQDARKLVEHFSPGVPISDDKIRRYCREGRITGQQIDKRWVMTLGALFEADLVPLEALDAYGEVLDIPDGVPEEWATPLAPHEPGPLERMLAADAAAQAAADDFDAAAARPSGADNAAPDEVTEMVTVDEPPVEPVSSSGDPDTSLAWVLDDADDADLAPEPQPARGAAGAPVAPTTRTAIDPAGPSRRRRRAVAVAVPLAVVLAAAGIIATSGDRSSPAQAQAEPSAATVQIADQRRKRDQEVALRTTMNIAAKRGDFRAAIDSADQLNDLASSKRFRSEAAATLLRRARTAAERGDLDRARGLVQRSRRYVDTDGAAQVGRRVDEIERARRARAAKSKRDAARRAATSRQAAPPASNGTRPSPAETDPEPSGSSSTPATPSRPSPSPTPSSGTASGGGSSKKPDTNNEFDYLGG